MNDIFTFARPEWLGEVASTSDLLKERAASAPPPSGTVIAALRQTRGRGRMNARWQSSGIGDLTFSFYWSGGPDAFQAGTLPMACALGVGDFLAREPWRVTTRCKWPNDVLADDGKICGILAEGGMTRDGAFGLVVGIGVNIRPAPGRDAALGRKTASLEDFTAGPAGEPAELLPPLLDNLQTRIAAWQAGGFAAIRTDLEKRLWGVGRGISAKTVHGRAEGIVEGLGENGELMLRGADNGLTAVASVSAIESGWV